MPKVKPRPAPSCSNPLVGARPTQDRVIIQVDSPVTETKSGIVLPDAVHTRHRQQQGTVVAVGPGVRDETGKLHSVALDIGDRVLFQRFAGTEIDGPFPGDVEEYIILREADVLAVLETA